MSRNNRLADLGRRGRDGLKSFSQQSGDSFFPILNLDVAEFQIGSGEHSVTDDVIRILRGTRDINFKSGRKEKSFDRLCCG